MLALANQALFRTPLHVLLSIFAHILLQTEPPVVITTDLPALLASFLALAGWAGFVAALINVGKLVGAVPDGNAPKVSLVLNGLGFAALVIVKVFWPTFDVAGADQSLAIVASTLTSVLALLAQFGVSKLVNNGIRGLPLIGFSHTQSKT